MTTIEIISEDRAEETIYRAICGDRQATGATPGQALDALDRELAAQGQSLSTVAIVQRFIADDLFTAQQQTQLQILMKRFHTAVDSGEAIAPQVQSELENLVEAELMAVIERSARILKQTQGEKF